MILSHCIDVKILSFIKWVRSLFNLFCKALAFSITRTCGSNITEFLTILYSRGLLSNNKNYKTIEIINFVTSVKELAVCVFVITSFLFNLVTIFRVPKPMFISFGYIVTFLSSKSLHLRLMAEEQFATMSGFTIDCMSFLKSLRISWYIKGAIGLSDCYFTKIGCKVLATKLKNVKLAGVIGSSTAAFTFA